ncbi:MAG: class I SAM-dependent methyltransferase [Deltaproteobacteria bacterium]|nr:class I SAM-dependent methyltransferase [Deltaproteobacteria bacterium]
MQPDSTAVRTALWRALHVELDAPPHVLEDTLGLQLAAPPPGWRERGDMHPQGTAVFRASIVARARFVEDLVAGAGIDQYVLLGAGLDTFVQRHPDAAVRVFEIDRPEPQDWKRARLAELGLPAPVFVPVDFERDQSWLAALVAAGFDRTRPAIIAATGLTMYLSRDANSALLREVAGLAPRSVFVATFLLPLEMADPVVRPGLERAAQGARASGTPFVSYFRPPELLELALAAGFSRAEHVSADALAARYFANRADGLRPPRNAEELLVATV